MGSSKSKTTPLIHHPKIKTPRKFYIYEGFLLSD